MSKSTTARELWHMLREEVKEQKLSMEFEDDAFDLYFEEVSHAYAGRAYHNLNHIVKVILAIHSFGTEARSKALLQLAAWFQDIVYDPNKRNNEELSAAAFERFAREFNFTERVIDTVRELILATRHLDVELETEEEKIICDADLYELATVNYVENSIKIRREYSHMSHDEWKNKRTKFLQNLLKRDYIFNTDQFREDFEDAARRHINLEIVFLSYIKTY